MDRHANRFCGSGEEGDRGFYLRLEDVADGPTLEVGLGSFHDIEALGLEYEKRFADNSPFILVQLRARNSDLYACAKIYAPGTRDDITSRWMGYVREVESGLVAAMKQQRPDADINGSAMLCNSRDEVILRMLGKYAGTEQVRKYKVFKA